ncbi:MAG: LamG-like jellyroll fold domain-containing protein, partial [Limisphaerales bacterium]
MTAGQRVYFDKLEPVAGLSWELVDAQNSKRFTLNLDAADPDPGLITFNSGGNATLTVYGRGDRTGTYRFKLWPETIQNFSIEVGDEVSDGDPDEGAGRVEVPGSQDVYAFPIAAGQTVFFDRLSDTPGLTWALKDPDGAQRFIGNLDAGTTDPVRVTFGTTGIAQLTVSSRSDATGPYRFKLWDVVDEAFAIAIGDTVSTGSPGAGAGLLGVPGAWDVYSIPVQAGQTVYFDRVSDAPGLSWRLVDAAGDERFNASMDAGVADPGNITFATAGTATLRVYGRGDATGGYAFKIWSALPNLLLQPASQTAPLGGLAIFRVLAESPGTPTYQWFRGTQVLTNQTGSVLTLTNLQAEDAGTYTVRVENQAGFVVSSEAILVVKEDAECVPVPEGLAALWSGDPRALELVHGVAGEFLNGATLTGGLVGDAFHFDGLDDAVRAPSSLLGTTFSKISMLAWIRPSSHGSGVDGYGRVVLAKTDTDGFALRVKDGSLQADLRLTGGNVSTTFSSTVLVLNEWSLVAVTYDGARVTGYVNGVPVGSVAASGGVRNTANSATAVMLGHEPTGGEVSAPGYAWHGAIDDAAVVGRALTGEELRVLFNSRGMGFCTLAPTLVLSRTSLDYDQGSPAVILDPLAVVADTDTSDLDGGVLTVRVLTGGAAGDRVELVAGGEGEDAVVLSDGEVRVGGRWVGTWSDGQGVGAELSVDLRAGSDALDVQRILRRVGYLFDGPVVAPSERVLEVVVDDGQGGVSVPGTLKVRVLPTNHAPVVTVFGPTEYTLAELTPLTVLFEGSDIDPGQTVSFSLDAGQPQGASIGASTGVLNWQPNEAQGPGVYTITVRGTDSAPNPASAAITLTVTVVETNQNPAISLPSPILTRDSLVEFTVSATDADLPTQSLSFSLGTGAPPGTSIDPTTGKVTWTIGSEIADGEYSIPIRVSDDGTPAGSATGSVIVRLDRRGPRVVAVSPLGAVSQPVNSIDVTFDSAIATSSVPASALAVTGGTARIPATSVTRLSDRVFRFGFSAPLGAGTYVVTINPAPRDLAGNSMDQDGDGRGGELVDDVYSAGLEILLPDLVAGNVATEGPVTAGEPFLVQWKLRNIGTGSVEGEWKERIILLPSGEMEQEVLLGEVTYSGALPAGGTVPRTALVILPGIPVSDVSVFVVTDSGGVIVEARDDNNHSEASEPVDVRIPNLVVEALMAPTEALFGQGIDVMWWVSNQGTAEAGAGWVDRVYLRKVGDAGSGILLWEQSRPLGSGKLSPGTLYTQPEPLVLNLPVGSGFEPGAYEIIILADATDEQVESVSTDNRKVSAPFEIAYPPLPDLVAVSVTGQPVLGSYGQPGEAFAVEWTVRNAGDQMASGPWV